jgi:hypothetical protein
VEKALLITHTHVVQPTFKGENGDEIWMVQNQHLSVICKVYAPFIEYASCAYEWALCNNLCKHQVIIILTCVDLMKENIIEYCGTWYGIDHNAFKQCIHIQHTCNLMMAIWKMRIVSKICMRTMLSLKGNIGLA